MSSLPDMAHVCSAFAALYSLTNAAPQQEEDSRLATLPECSVEDLIDAAWYQDTYPDIASSKTDPVYHYLNFGWREMRSPNAWFDPYYYLSQYPGLDMSGGFMPVRHFITTGAAAGGRPHPGFDLPWYAGRYLNAAPGAEALAHFLRTGIGQGAVPDPRLDRVEVEDRLNALSPSARITLLQELQRSLPDTEELTACLVEEQWYERQYPDFVSSGLRAAEHYRHYGADSGYDPNPWFCTTWYLIRHPEAAQSGCSALAHFVKQGAAAGLDPSPFFDVSWYAATYLRTRSPHAETLRHFLHAGCRTGAVPEPAFYQPRYISEVQNAPSLARRSLLIRWRAAERNDIRLISSLVDPEWYRIQYADIVEGVSNAILHYHQSGWKLSLNPNPCFDTAWYLAQNPNLKDGLVSPLIHFIAEGAAAGQNPHAEIDLAQHALEYFGGKPSASVLEHILLLKKNSCI